MTYKIKKALDTIYNMMINENELLDSDIVTLHNLFDTVLHELDRINID